MKLQYILGLVESYGIDPRNVELEDYYDGQYFDGVFMEHETKDSVKIKLLSQVRLTLEGTRDC